MSNYITAKQAATVPMADGSHHVVDAGDVIDLDQTSDTFREQWESNDYTKALFKSGGEPERSGRGEDDLLPFGESAGANQAVEALSRERATLSEAERHGASSVAEDVPPMGSPGRTLPESGVDVAANEKFAEGSADTSESGKDRVAVAEAKGLPSPVGEVAGGGAKPAESHETEARGGKGPQHARKDSKAEQKAEQPKGESQQNRGQA
jgi:hypothetical protein